MINLNDPILKRNNGDIFGIIGGFVPGKPTILIYASCHGRTLLDYFRDRMVHQHFNVIRLETGPITTSIRMGVDVFSNQTIQEMFSIADVIVTYNMGARHGPIALENVRHLFGSKSKVITMTAPNCSCFWPIAFGYGGGIGVFDALDCGKNPDEVWRSFQDGTFDPKFNIRYRLELGRLSDKDSYHDVKLSDFVHRNHKKAKLFMGSSHPSYVTVAHLGSSILEIIGLNPQSECEIIGLDPSHGAVSGYPETDYEFKHYGFEYKITHVSNGPSGDVYKRMFDAWVSAWHGGGLIPPVPD